MHLNGCPFGIHIALYHIRGFWTRRSPQKIPRPGKEKMTMEKKQTRKINIIDLIVLIVIAAVAVGVVLKMTGILDKSSGKEEAGSSVVEYTVKVLRVDPSVYQAVRGHIEAGDTQFMTNGGKEVDGSQVLSIRSEPYVFTTVLDDGKGTTVKSEDPYYLDVYFTCRSTTSNAEAHTVGTQEVRIGRNFIVKARNYELTGTIMECDTVEAEPQPQA